MRALIRPLVALLAAPALLGATAGTASATTNNIPCLHGGVYGDTCIYIHGDKLRVDDVIGYFVPPNRDAMTGLTWRFEITTYADKPNGKTKADVPPTHTYYSKPRKGNPKQQGSQCTSETFGVQDVAVDQTTLTDCSSYGLAQAQETNGAFRPAYHGVHHYADGTWMCMEIQKKVHGTWHDNGPAGPGSKGERACTEIHT